MSATAFFPLPIAFEPEDQYWMDYASKLIRGEDVQITWPGSTTQCDRDQVRFFLEETAEVGEAFTFFNRSQEILEFAGGKVSLGWVTEIDHSAKLDNLGELTTWYDTGRDGRIEVRLALANNNQMTVRLSGAHEETDIDPPYRSHPELTSHSQQRPQCERIVATTATDRDVNRHPVTTTEEARLAAAAPGVGNRYT